MQASVWGRQLHGVAQPGGPSQSWPEGQSALLRHGAGPASLGQKAPVQASSPPGPQLQTLQPSPAGQLAPTGQSPPPGSTHAGGGPPSGVMETSIDRGRSTSTGASVASVPPSVGPSETEAPQPERDSQRPATPAVVVHRMA